MTDTTRPCPRCGTRGTGRFCIQCGAGLDGLRCASCGKDLPPAARFCTSCGQAAGGGGAPVAGARSAETLPWVVAGVAVAAAVILGGLYLRASEPVAPLQSGLQPSPGAATTDISTMTPRERADRLFDRVMTAAERGDTSEVSFFGPMALAAHSMLATQDPDSRYHMALIQQALGNREASLAQADSIELLNANHLFAPSVRYAVATRFEDASLQQSALAAFGTRYQREIGAGRQEYTLHQRTIEDMRSRATTP